MRPQRTHHRHFRASTTGPTDPRGWLIVASAVLSSGCLTPPPPKCSCDETSQSEAVASDSGAGSDLSVEEQVQALELTPVVPEAPVIWDGQSISLVNIDPAGSWFVFNDGSAKGEMIPEGTGAFESAIEDGMVHSEGTGFTEWGGGMGMNFVGLPMLTPVDASKYEGISFEASGEGWVHVGLATVITLPEFGICDAEQSKCYDHYAVDIKLTDEVKTYEYTWDELRQAGWGAPTAELDPKMVVGLNFTSQGPKPWNFDIGTIQFLE